MAAVVGVPDATRTEIVKAFVVLNPGHTGDEALVQALQAHMCARASPRTSIRARSRSSTACR